MILYLNRNYILRTNMFIIPVSQYKREVWHISDHKKWKKYIRNMSNDENLFICICETICFRSTRRMDRNWNGIKLGIDYRIMQGLGLLRRIFENRKIFLSLSWNSAWICQKIFSDSEPEPNPTTTTKKNIFVNTKCGPNLKYFYPKYEKKLHL